MLLLCEPKVFKFLSGTSRGVALFTSAKVMAVILAQPGSEFKTFSHCWGLQDGCHYYGNASPIIIEGVLSVCAACKTSMIDTN